MGTLRSTFILRYWYLSDGTERVAIEHVQSGDNAHAVTLAAAFDWLAGRTGPARAGPGVARGGDTAPAEEAAPALPPDDP